MTILFQRPHNYGIGAEELQRRWIALERELANHHETQGKIGRGRDAEIVRALRREMQEALGLVVDPAALT